MKNLFDVSGKVALVTGGSRGIGEMIAEGITDADGHDFSAFGTALEFFT